MADQRATFRSSQMNKMEAGRGDKMKKLQRDDAVHATLLKHKVGTAAHTPAVGWNKAKE